MPTDSRFLCLSRAYTVMWAEKIQNIRHIIDNISVQAGRYAVARAEKIILGSRFLSPSRAYTVARAEKLPADSRFLCLSWGYAGARAEKFSTDSRFLSLSRGICWCEGREIAYRQQISLPKPWDMLVRGQRNCLQTAYFSA